MLVFEEKDAVSVLGALRSHLAKRGFYEYNDMPRGSAGSEMWTFNSPGGDIVHFASGFAGSLRKFEFLYPRIPLLTPAIQELGSACVVVVDRRESWLDVRLRGLRRFLSGASS